MGGQRMRGENLGENQGENPSLQGFGGWSKRAVPAGHAPAMGDRLTVGLQTLTLPV